MRRTSAVLTALLVGLSVLVGPAGSGAPPSPRAVVAQPASYDYLRAQVFTAPGLGAIAVGMPTKKVVKVQHRTEGGDWSRPRVLFRKKGVTCGAIEGRASAGGVALLLACDTPYFEEDVPMHGMAAVTQDLVSWSVKRLRAGSYHDPAISGDGSHAAWLHGPHGQYQLFSEGAGFTTGHTSFDYDSGGETVVVDDAGTVTVMGPDGTGDGCVLAVHDQPLTGPEDVYAVAGVDPGCTEGMVENVDDRTVVGGGTAREYRFTVTREPGERWELRSPPPVTAPGLVMHTGPPESVIHNIFSDAAGLPLVSMGSPDRQRLVVQTFDEGAGSWTPAATVYDHGFPGCTANDTRPFSPGLKVHAIPLHCYPRPNAEGDYPWLHEGSLLPLNKVRLLTSPDALSWNVTVINRRPYAFSRSGALLAVAGPTSITIVSPSGTTSVPRTAPGPCDFVFPIGPESVLRFHGGERDRWPTKLQKSVAGDPWRTIQVVKMPDRGRCRNAHATISDLPSLFHLQGLPQTIKVTVRPGGRGGWHVEKTPNRF